MPELPDLFPGFASHRIDTGIGPIFARTGGAGPPLLLLHGFPQTHAMWHRLAPALAQHFSLVLMDLRGYGASAAPEADGEHRTYSKRAMASDAIAVMAALGHGRFFLAGHDRGGRVGYRLALDHPARVERLALIDIVPTFEMWAGMDAARALSTYHWMFLAQPGGLPERLIGAAPLDFLDHTLASWTATKTLTAFDERALTHYRHAFVQPGRIHAACEDYRAGAGPDRSDDAADRETGRKILCPTLALWGVAGFPVQGRSALDVWREWAVDVTGASVAGGHFLPEESPKATGEALLSFFKA